MLIDFFRSDGALRVIFVAVGGKFCLELPWLVVDSSAHTTVRYNSGLLLKILLEMNVFLILIFHKCTDVGDF